MNHNFNVEIAAKYGLLEAILFENITYWVSKNKANQVHFHDGLYWTYNSAKAFSEMFPYASPRTISRALHHLRDEGLIVTGNYNASPYDRTTWYAVTEKGMRALQNDNMHSPDCQMEKTDCQMKAPEMSNESVKNGEPIPDINPAINTDSNNNSVGDTVTDTCAAPEKEHSERLVYDRIRDDYNNTCTDLPKVSAMSEARKRGIRTLLNELEKLKLLPGLTPYEKLHQIFSAAHSSDFLSNRDGKWNGCSFDWLIKKANALKILEGNYANKGGANNDGSGTGSGNAEKSDRPRNHSEKTKNEMLERYRRNKDKFDEQGL